MGLVEVGVGLIPGGGGNLMLLRNLYGPFATDRDFDPLPFLKKLFLTIGTAKVATTAEEAREIGFLTAPTASASTETSSSATPRRGCWAWRTRASGRRGPRTSGSRAGAARRRWT